MNNTFQLMKPFHLIPINRAQLMKPLLTALSLIVIGASSCLCVQAADLAQDFTKPSAAAKAGVLWMWMDGNISKEGITADLEAMARVGIGRALIFNVKSEVQGGPAPFFSPQWFDLFHFAVSEAERLGLEISFHNCAGYSSSGGPWIKPQNAAQIIVVGEVQAQGGTTFDAVLPQGKLQQNFHHDISVLAFPTPTDATRTHDINKMAIFGHGHPSLKGQQPSPRQVPAGAIIDPARMINLTDKMDGDGRLRWEVPAGNWTILRIGRTCTGNVNVPSPGSGQGLECDKLSREAMDVHWVGGIQPILDKVGPLAGKILNVCHIDSYEAGGGNWTPLMQEEFKKRRGYDLVPFLPAMTGRIVGSSEITERFLWDLRRTISDLFAENYYGHFAELCHKHGLQAMCEPYDGPFEGLQVGAQVDLPMAEFWADPEMDHYDLAKLAASIAHTRGTTLVPAESFTAFPRSSRWTGDPAFLKGRGDAMWCEGINRFELHTYAHQPWTNPERYPGMTMSQWGTQFGRCVTWWEQSKAWFSYVARSQQLLQSGQPVEDVLVFGGEAAPNCMLPYRKDIRDNGWDYALVGTDQIGKLTVRDGNIITPAGTKYRLLVLPDTTWMTPAVARHVRDLVQAGAAVLGPKPQRSPSLGNFPACDEEVRTIADAVWGAGSGERRVGQGRVFSGMKVEQALAALDVKPDFVNEDKAGRLKWIHRVADGADVYFISNQKTVMAEAACAFRISGRQPELWHPDTGVMEKAPAFSEKDGYTTVPLRFDPMGSLFVVFRQPAPADPIVAVKQTRPAAAQVRPELKIIKAEYGVFDLVGTRCYDVTAEVKKLYAGKLRICSVNLAGRDPAPDQPKELFVEYTVEGSSKQMMIKGNEVMELPAKVEIVRAIYGIEPDKKATLPVTQQIVDITKRLNAFVKDGEITVRADVALAGVDPAPGMPKKLRVEYSVGGSKHVCVVENHPLFSMPGILCLPELANASVQPSAFEMGAADDGKPTVLAWQPVTVELTTAAGKKLNVDVAQVPSPVEISGVWELAFPPNLGAPATVALDKLISWTEHANSGVKYFSGTASYRKTFVSKAVRDNGRTRVYLDLGKVKNIAEVKLNGKELGILWKPPFRVEVTGALRDGKNELEVRVTNLWPNRLIGDEQLPEDRDWHGKGLRTLPRWVLDGKPSPTGRFTFTTFHHWTPLDEPLPSGLLGPVLLRTAVVVPVGVKR